MRVRHKTPTLVSMWMLDVFCCALGCVTLLWLLNTRQASDQAVAAKSVSERLEMTRLDLTDTLTRVKALNSDVETLAGRLRIALDDQAQLTGQLGFAHAEAHALSGQLDDANRALGTMRSDVEKTKTALAAAEAQADMRATDLAAARDLAAAKAKDLATAESRASAVERELVLKKQQLDDLMLKANTATAAVDGLAKLVEDRSAERLELDARVLALRRELSDLEGKYAAAEKSKDSTSTAAKAAADKAKTDLDAAKIEATKATQELASARKTIAELEGKLNGAGTDKATIIDLQGQNAKLADKLDKIHRDTENRFAGVATTGRRVVFMVDMSGSMMKSDDRTLNSAKWPLVCETLTKVMRSIPTLEKFQVVVFSRSARFVMAPAGEWRTYEGEKTVEAVKVELLKIVPDGDTNLHTGFDLAFSLKPQGLDTIYLFSDGLPTSGPGLSVAQENAGYDEAKRSEILGEYLLQQLRTRWNPTTVGVTRVRINAIGFFYQSPNVGAFLWSLSRDNDGSFVGMSRP